MVVWNRAKSVASWLLVAALACVSALAAAAEPQLVVGLITKTETNPYFVEMRRGAEAEAKSQGLRLLTGAGRRDGDNAGQVTALENMVAAGARAILITPSDAKAIVPALRRARAAGVLVIALDSATDPVGAADALFATDNYRAGELIGHYARARLGAAKPRIVMLDLFPGHPVGAQRHNGFLKGFGLPAPGADSNVTGRDPAIACMADTAGEQARAQTAMENCLQRAPDANVVYTINEPAAAGAWMALDKAGKAGGVVVVSVDGGCAGVADVARGRLAATAQQYPLRMAQRGVAAAADFLRGGTRPAGLVDTGVALVARAPVPGIESLDAAAGGALCWGRR
jgi:fructose transport system substrate-binding protein